MTPTFNFNISLVFDGDDMDIKIKTSAEDIDTVKLAAIAMFFKEAMTAQAEAMAGLAIEYGRMAETIQNHGDDDWE